MIVLQDHHCTRCCRTIPAHTHMHVGRQVSCRCQLCSSPTRSVFMYVRAGNSGAGVFLSARPVAVCLHVLHWMVVGLSASLPAAVHAARLDPRAGHASFSTAGTTTTTTTTAMTRTLLLLRTCHVRLLCVSEPLDPHAVYKRGSPPALFCVLIVCSCAGFVAPHQRSGCSRSPDANLRVGGQSGGGVLRFHAARTLHSVLLHSGVLCEPVGVRLPGVVVHGPPDEVRGVGLLGRVRIRSYIPCQIPACHSPCAPDGWMGGTDFD